jgi:hypothetical protein
MEFYTGILTYSFFFTVLTYFALLPQGVFCLTGLDFLPSPPPCG